MFYLTVIVFILGLVWGQSLWRSRCGPRAASWRPLSYSKERLSSVGTQENMKVERRLEKTPTCASGSKHSTRAVFDEGTKLEHGTSSKESVPSTPPVKGTLQRSPTLSSPLMSDGWCVALWSRSVLPVSPTSTCS